MTPVERMRVDVWEVDGWGDDDDEDGAGEVVLLGREVEAESEMRLSTVSTMLMASSIPFLPVTAFAHPELTTNAFALPPPLRRTSWEMTTGAALKTFRVKDAAEAVGFELVERNRPRSSGDGLEGEDFLMEAEVEERE
jgi:hypothetical protein